MNLLFPRPALQRDDAVHGRCRPAFAHAVGPLDDHCRHLCRAAEADVNPRVAGRQIAAVGPNPAPDGRRPARSTPIQAPNPKRLPCACCRRTCSQWFFVPSLIEEQPHRPVVVGHHDVDVAVVVDVAERSAAADLGASERRAPALLVSSNLPAPGLRNN